MSGRRQYPFHLIEPKWQKVWDEQNAFRAFNPNEEIPANHPFAQRHKLSGKISAMQLPPKFYILDMFPYPSGAGLHVGHPEGYTATDILARYKRAQGFNVLHPMGWDAFGLPAEQYAVKTGQHPRVTTEQNIANFTRQIKSLGFSYDWSREISTTDENYFKWTQWIFLKLYNSWFNPKTNKAEPIETLKCPENWNESSKRKYHDNNRLAYVSEQPVWWCEQLGTVLANEEVVDGKSEVGGFPVVRKPMRQWMLRITKYAERLLQDLETIDWTNSLKEMQRNWIGRSEGAEVDFQIAGSPQYLRVFTTRPDTLFGATYMVLAPEHKFVNQLIQSAEQPPLVNEEISATKILMTQPNGDAIGMTSLSGALKYVRERGMALIQITVIGGKDTALCVVQDLGAFKLARQELVKHIEAICKYRNEVANKSDLERTELAKEKTGVFTGAFAINPVNSEKIPIWIADYVLASYGTGAIMAVPAHDERDFEFATKFNLPIIHVVGSAPAPGAVSRALAGNMSGENISSTSKISTRPIAADGASAAAPGAGALPFIAEGVSVNSTNAEISLNGLPTLEAKKKITAWLESKNLGKRTVNYKLRDWLFSRQRYWGEPFPIVWKKDSAGNLFHEALPESALPVLPPKLTDYKPTANGEPPLARAKDWVNEIPGATRETNTMPQWAGSCWYYLRYLDARRGESFCGTLSEHYWMGAPTSGLLLSDAQWKSRLSELLAALQTANRAKHYITYAVIGDEEAIKLKNATGLDLQNFRRFIDNQAVAHILNEHGDPKIEESRGQLAVTPDDIALIPLIVTNPDAARHAGKTRRHLDAIFYEKRVNGFLCCVEEVREGAGLLAVKTFYKRKATGAYAVSSLNQTSETFRRSESNKTENSPQVKPTPGVDLYVGGTEHAVLHLLYARFWHKVLFDLGYVSTPEPFFKLVNQGLILGEDGQKMSKSRGNVVNPDDVLGEYGADAFRLYEMFMGPLEMVKPWNTKGVEGVYRFLGRVWRLFVDEKSETEFEQAETLTTKKQSNKELLNLIKLNSSIQNVAATPAQLKTLHTCIKKVTEDLDSLRFNTAISAMMVFVNDAISWETKPVFVLRDFLILLQPFAPHLAEELWSKVQSPKSKVGAAEKTLDVGLETLDLSYQPWPKFNPALLVESEIEIPVQVNGKLRDVIKVSADADNATIENMAKDSEKVQQFIADKMIKKIIIVPKKMVNLIVA